MTERNTHTRASLMSLWWFRTSRTQLPRPTIQQNYHYFNLPYTKLYLRRCNIITFYAPFLLLPTHSTMQNKLHASGL